MFANLFKRSPSTANAVQQLIEHGNRLEDAGQLQEACDLYRRATRDAPTLPASHLNLGIVLAAMGDLRGAEQAYEVVLALEPDHPFGNYNFANLAYAQGDLVRAESLVRRALRSRPELTQAHVLLSNLLDDSDRIDVAIAAIQEAVRLQPDHLGARCNLAGLLRKTRRYDEAMEVIDSILQTDARNVTAHVLQASVLEDQGLMLESLQALRRALGLDPQRFDLQSRELFVLNFDEDTDAGDLFHRHAEFGMRMEAAVAPRFAGSRRGTLDPKRRLRLGYVSGDLRVHPVALFLLPLLERHDRTSFEVICYSCDPRHDHFTERLRASSDRWVDAHGMSEPKLAQQIYDDAVDILIDLSGHSGTVRLAVFCEKPAPVQMTWLGYLNTTGLTRMDYRLCDVRSDPPGTTSQHTEALLPLPNSQWCYRPFMNVASELSLPASRNGYVTFGSFNNATKVSPRMCERWAQILSRVPGSRLLFCGVAEGPKRTQIQQVMERAGVPVNRLHFEPRVNVDDYYRIFHRVDISLDSYPYGGGTTTLDSLWMGVPVVATMGSSPVSRSAGSILQCVGLDDWVADSIDAYADVAVAKACDLLALASLRAGLQNRLATSSLMDEARYVTDLELLMRTAWRRYCAGEAVSVNC